MSLTKDDLQAITEIVSNAVERTERVLIKHVDKLTGHVDKVEATLIKRIDKVNDTLAIQMENGLQEVRNAVAGVESRLGSIESQLKEVTDTVGRIEMQQRTMVDQVDDHSVQIKKIKASLRLA